MPPRPYLNRELVIEFFRNAPPSAWSVRRVLKEMGLKGKHLGELDRIIRELADQGALELLEEGRKFRRPEPRRKSKSVVTGSLQGHPSGFAFLLRDDHEGPDIFLTARKREGAWHGDKVEVAIESDPDNPRPYGAVVRVVERGRRRLVGRYHAVGGHGAVQLDDPRYGFEVDIPVRLRGGALTGQMVAVNILEYPGPRHPNARGEIVKVLGDESDPNLDEQVILEKYGLEVEFPAAVISESEKVPDHVTAADREGREDLTGIPLVTIDGETARDFDDAVCVQPDGDGWILWVAIADVSHYVRPGTALDEEAYARSTSVYFPNRVIPMLPHRLSNGICSLNPGVERLALVAEMRFDAEGKELSAKARYMRAVFRSRHRLTYTRVFHLLEHPDEARTDEDRDVLSLVQPMRVLSRLIRAQRVRRGALDFDLPEAEIVINEEGFVEGIVRGQRNEAHRIIEDFMIAANESVSSHLVKSQRPCLFRIHEPPDEASFAAFADFLQTLGISVPRPKKLTPAAYQELLDRVKGHPEEGMIHMVMLRSMMQARYSPDNAGHFGLASECYGHFTSPIRRYPDLIVHRLLGMWLDHAPAAEFKAKQGYLHEAGDHCSVRERNAVDAEREYESLKKAHFMARHLGNRYEGRIVGVTAFGLFVELKEIFVEGLVPMEAITDDHYLLDEAGHRLVGRRTSRVFKLGSPVEIVVNSVDIPNRRIRFLMADMEAPAVGAQPVRATVQRAGKTEREKSKKKETARPQGRGRGQREKGAKSGKGRRR